MSHDSFSNFTNLRTVSSTKPPLVNGDFFHQAHLGATLGQPVVKEFLKQCLKFLGILLARNHYLGGSQPMLGGV